MKHILATLFFLLTIIGFAQTTDLDSLEILDIQEFGFVGQTEAVLIPEGVVAVQIDAYGAQGESGGAPDYAAGGRGAQVSAVLFEPLPLELVFSIGGSTGFNGGGIGGQGVNTGNCNDYGGGHAGNGGGYTAVWTSNFQLAEVDDELIVVAAGGGGGGVRYCNCCGYSLDPLPEGGDGGWFGETAVHGARVGGQVATMLTGGGGASEFEGGLGGFVQCWGDVCSTSPTNGSSMTGGDGLTEGWYGVAGGGGGGGWFGGGGGGGGSGGDGAAGAGGGGGSSYVASYIDTIQATSGAREGNGFLRLTFYYESTGCTNPLACNYASSAITDDGSCDFCLCGDGTSWNAELASCIPSFELSDACGEGTVWSDSIQACVSAIALHESCGEGTVWDEDSQTCIIDETYCSWQPDSDGDQLIGVSDLLMFLSVFGDTDLDQDGIFDSNDDCVGEYDECGVCNGNGPSVPIIESIEIQFDSLYAEQIDEWLVYEYADTTFQYVCSVGCTDPTAENYDPSADSDDGSCLYPWACGDPLEYQGYDYETVQIGEQCWFAENLRNSEYRNGDEISSSLSDAQWASTTSGAMSTYGEDSNQCSDDSPTGNSCDPEFALEEFGALYNGYAVNDARGLCPSGWFVPSDDDWAELIQVVEPPAGMSLKSTYGWFLGGDGTNSSGFSGLAGGSRGNFGNYANAGQYGMWWSSSQFSVGNYVKWLYHAGDEVTYNSFPWNDGCSVRCIKDTE